MSHYAYAFEAKISSKYFHSLNLMTKNKLDDIHIDYIYDVHFLSTVDYCQ